MKYFDMSKITALPVGSVISVTGCAGKTTLIEYAAMLLSKNYRVGIATTVNIMYPMRGNYHGIYIGECKDTILKNGIYYFADEVKLTIPRKLHGLSQQLLSQARERVDYLFVEADGSAGKPLKIWREDEPVILDETTLTIGVAALECIGEKADEHHIHRFEQYKKRNPDLSNIITKEMFYKMFDCKNGMFAHVKSEKAIWLNQTRIAAIVLASGFSRRMGINKLLMTIDGKPMIEKVLEVVREVSFAQRFLVTNNDMILKMGTAYGFVDIENDHAQDGQSTSVVCGVTAAKDISPEGFMFFMGDMPFIEAGMIRKLKTAFAASVGKKIIVPLYPEGDGEAYRRGNPVIFPAAFLNELMSLTGDAGGRSIIRAHEDDVYEVRLSDARWGHDIDCMNDVPDACQ